MGFFVFGREWRRFASYCARAARTDMWFFQAMCVVFVVFDLKPAVTLAGLVFTMQEVILVGYSSAGGFVFLEHGWNHLAGADTTPLHVFPSQVDGDF